MTTKKSSKKKSVKTRITPKSKIKSQNQENVDKILIQNFVSLQKIMVNLSVKFDELSTQISKLLSLFELSAKTLATKNFNLTGREENKELMKKIDNLLDQNKTIARGLTLMYEGAVNHQTSARQPQMQPTSVANPLGREGNYQKSISTGVE